ncbi:MAG: LiaF-related protein [Clostridiales bacterium]
MRNFGSVCWGVLLILLGVILGGNALNFWAIDIFFHGWWTLFIIIPCVASIIKKGFNWCNSVGLIIGLGLLVSAWGIIPWGLLWKLIIPGFFVILGIALIFGIGGIKRFMYPKNNTNSNIASFCSNAQGRVTNEPYYGGKISAVMGTSVLDLSCAIIEKDIHISAYAFMGSVEIFFPPNVKIMISSSPFLGSVENKTTQSMAINCPTVHLDCSAILGSIELK